MIASRPATLWTRPRLLLPLLAVCVCILLSVSEAQYSSDAERIFLTLAGFRERGQLFIETFPPLSFMLTTYTMNQLALMHATGQFLASSMIALYLIKAMFGPQNLRISLAVWFLVCGAVSATVAMLNEAALLPLSPSNNLAESLILVCLAASALKFPTSRWSAAILGGLKDILCVVAGCLSMSLYQAISCFILLQLDETTAILKRISDLQTPLMRTAGSLLWIYVRSAILVITTICVITSIIYPLSETSYGGNYNLHYLPYNIRRDLRPPIAGAPLEKSASLHEGVKPNIPLTMYSEGAGFLSADDAVWNRYQSAFAANTSSPTGDITLEQAEQDAEEAKYHRVTLQDNLGAVSPLFFQCVMSSNLTKTAIATQTHFLHGQLVYLRDYEKGRFIAPRKNMQALADAYTGVDYLESEPKRTRVAAVDTVSKEAEWQILYDKTGGAGFHLYNSELKCYLASSYRSIPYRDSLEEDPVLMAVKTELELACTDKPTKAASRLYVVDGVAKPALAQTFLPRRFALWEIKARGYMQYSFAILDAMRRLHAFRKAHGKLQDVPEVVMNLHQAEPYGENVRVCLTTFLVGTVLASLMRVLWAARRERDGEQSPKKYTRESVAVPPCSVYMLLLPAIIIWQLVCNPHDWRFATGLAFILWAEMIRAK